MATMTDATTNASFRILISSSRSLQSRDISTSMPPTAVSPNTIRRPSKIFGSLPHFLLVVILLLNLTTFAGATSLSNPAVAAAALNAVQRDNTINHPNRDPGSAAVHLNAINQHLWRRDSTNPGPPPSAPRSRSARTRKTQRPRQLVLPHDDQVKPSELAPKYARNLLKAPPAS